MKFKIYWILGLMLLTKGLSAADPVLAQKWVNYGQQVYAQRDYVKAQQAFTTAARADSRNAAAWKGLGNVLYMKGDKANALKYYKYALALNPSDAALAAFVARMGGAPAAPAGALATANREYAARQYAAAAGHYQQATTENPNDAKAWQGLGNARYAQNDRPGAMQAYNKALELNPSNVALKNFVDKAGGGAQASGETDWGQPLWRSAVLPGWGQAYNGSPVKAWTIGLSSLALLGTTIYTYTAGDAARLEYLSVTGTDQAAYDKPFATWESMASINHLTYALFGAVYVYGLVDAIIGAKPKSAYRAGLGEAETEVAGLNLKLNAMGTPMLQTKLLEF
jgi:tetratricopeptide (TPR) repeat protein